MANRHAIADAPQPSEMVLAEWMLDGLLSDIFQDVHDFPGATDYNLAARHGPVLRVDRALDDAIRMQLLDSVRCYSTSEGRLLYDPKAVHKDEEIVSSFRMLYLGEAAGGYIQRRDRVPPNRSVGRHNASKHQDHRRVRPHRSHTIGLDDVVTGLRLAGFQVCSGRRDIVDSLPLPAGVRWVHGKRLPQLVPDAVLRANVFYGEALVQRVTENWGPRIVGEVRDLLAPYLAGPEEPQHRMLLVCPNPSMVKMIREEAKEVVDREGVRLEVDAVAEGTYRFGKAPNDGPGNLLMLFATREFLLEYERSARNPARVNRKIRSYVAQAKWGIKKSLAFVAETEGPEATAIQRARELLDEYEVDMEIVTSTYGRITGVLTADNRDVWHCVGRALVIV